MPCHPYVDEQGHVFLINCREPRLPACEFCGKTAPKLCDFPTGNGKTCDATICDACAKSVGFDRDYCPAHAPQRSLFGGQE
ncbi:hypothetical protein H7849_11775 [Alloacidobacterium dinghuense]|uniref:Uncharacterized protein n=1 Tax=Alloacidobacterium dinghuense TaxID=2763107 RepID=A0A7G8BPN4_9BACT|nr:hypothetical protein [Alloacidobacterium dinghuense]QNI34504.1 hypothetical protein H7849_11775 [Alloacidobacterium dinghuense]